MSLELEEATRRPWLKWILAAVLLVGVGAAVLIPRLTAKPAPRFDTTKADRGPIVARVTATGIVSALVTVQVGSQVSGRLAAINVDFNSPVKKGEVIAKIDPALFNAALEQARASYLSAEAALKKAQVQARDQNLQRGRSEQLRKQNLIAQADYDTAVANAEQAEAAVDAAKAQVEQARASLHQAQVNLEYTTIVSPINGVVISRAVDLGQTVAASFQAPTLFTIAEDLRRMQVDTSVAEADVGKLAPGMEATFLVDAFPNERFTGKIRQIRNAPQTVQNVVTYDAVIDVENPELKLRPGMTANVTFIYAQQKEALRVTNAALRFRPTPEMLGEAAAGHVRGQKGGRGAKASASPGEGATASAAGQQQPPLDAGALPSSGKGVGGGPALGKAVFVLREGRPRRVPVSVGISDGTTTEISDGDLHEGDLVITGLASEAGASPSGTPASGASQSPRAFRRPF